MLNLRRRSLQLVLGLLVMVSTLFSLSALAFPYGVGISGFASGQFRVSGGGGQIVELPGADPTGFVQNSREASFTIPVTTFASQPWGFASAGLDTVAKFGDLRADAFALAHLVPELTPFFHFSCQCADDNGADVRVDLTWQDTITIRSLNPNVLPLGAGVELSATLLLESHVHEFLPLLDALCPTSGRCFAGHGVIAYVNISDPIETLVFGSDGVINSGDSDKVQIAHSSLVRPVGSSFALAGFMSLSLSALTGTSYPNSTGATNGFNVALFNLDVLTPGATYTTESGRTYFTPNAIPEPSALLLFGSGLAGLALWRRKIKA